MSSNVRLHSDLASHRGLRTHAASMDLGWGWGSWLRTYSCPWKSPTIHPHSSLTQHSKLWVLVGARHRVGDGASLQLLGMPVTLESHQQHFTGSSHETRGLLSPAHPYPADPSYPLSLLPMLREMRTLGPKESSQVIFLPLPSRPLLHRGPSRRKGGGQHWKTG